MTTGQGARHFLHDLFQLKETQPNRYAAYFPLIGKQGLRLLSSIHWSQTTVTCTRDSADQGAKSVRPRRERMVLIPSLREGSERLGFNQLSAGTFQMLALTFYMLSNTYDALLLEEPDAGLHHTLLVTLMELIKSQSKHCQILLATHSDDVLDQVKPDNVFQVTRNSRDRSRVESLATSSSRRMANIREYLRTSGGLGEYRRVMGFDS